MNQKNIFFFKNITSSACCPQYNFIRNNFCIWYSCDLKKKKDKQISDGGCTRIIAYNRMCIPVIILSLKVMTYVFTASERNYKQLEDQALNTHNLCKYLLKLAHQLSCDAKSRVKYINKTNYRFTGMNALKRMYFPCCCDNATVSVQVFTSFKLSCACFGFWIARNGSKTGKLSYD